MTLLDCSNFPLNRTTLRRIFSSLIVSTTSFYQDRPCWEWQKSLSIGGYGRVGANKERFYAHRVTMTLFGEGLTPELECDHLCRNRKCVRPDHLEAVTHWENIRRGQTLPSKQRQQTHCKNGHPLPPPQKGLIRICAPCRRVNGRQWYRTWSEEKYQKVLATNRENKRRYRREAKERKGLL